MIIYIQSYCDLCLMSTQSIKIPPLQQTKHQITQTHSIKCIDCNKFFGSEEFKGYCSSCYRDLSLSPEQKQKRRQNNKKIVPETANNPQKQIKSDEQKQCCSDQDGSCRKSCRTCMQSICGCLGIALIYICCWPCICCGKTGFLGVK